MLGESDVGILLADRVDLIEAMNCCRAFFQAVPVVATTFTPTIEPSLAYGRESKRTEITGLAMQAELITADKGSFQRITLESSHRVLPSAVDCYVLSLPQGEAW